jgi:hypothetical protein
MERDVIDAEMAAMLVWLEKAKEELAGLEDSDPEISLLDDEIAQTTKAIRGKSGGKGRA